MSSSSDIDTDSIPSLQTISDSSPSPDNVDAPCPRGYKRDEHGQLVVDPESLEGEVRYIRPLCNVIVTKLHTAMSSISAPGNKYPIASIPPGIRWSLVMPEAIQRAVPCSGDLCGTRVTSLLSYGGETITFTLGARLISAHFVDDTGKTRSYLKLYLDPLRVVDLDALHNLILEVADDYKHVPLADFVVMSTPRPVRAQSAPLEYIPFDSIYDSSDVACSDDSELSRIAASELKTNDVLLVDFILARRMMCMHRWQVSVRPTKITRLLSSTPLPVPL